MKTITYSLASTKCMEEGWTVRPASPSLSDGEKIQDPFVIEVNPLQLVSTSHKIEMNCCEVRGIRHETQNRKTADGNENIKKKKIRKTTTFARASRFFVHFFVVTARLQREVANIHVLWRT